MDYSSQNFMFDGTCMNMLLFVAGFSRKTNASIVSKQIGVRTSCQIRLEKLIDRFLQDESRGDLRA